MITTIEQPKKLFIPPAPFIAGFASGFVAGVCMPTSIKGILKVVTTKVIGLDTLILRLFKEPPPRSVVRFKALKARRKRIKNYEKMF